MTESKTMAVGYVIPYLIAKAEGLEPTQAQYDELMDEFVESFLESYEDYTEEEAKEYILNTQGKYFAATLMSETVVDWPEAMLFVKAEGVALQLLLLFGGDEENRTPVRKPIHTTFFVDSLLFQIPVRGREQTHSLIR